MTYSKIHLQVFRLKWLDVIFYPPFRLCVCMWGVIVFVDGGLELLISLNQFYGRMRLLKSYPSLLARKIEHWWGSGTFNILIRNKQKRRGKMLIWYLCISLGCGWISQMVSFTHIFLGKDKNCSPSQWGRCSLSLKSSEPTTFIYLFINILLLIALREEKTWRRLYYTILCLQKFLNDILTHPICRGCRIRQFQLCRVVGPSPKEATSWPWVRPCEWYFPTGVYRACAKLSKI